MARPLKHPKTGVYWLRKRVPARLLGKVRGSVVQRSLRTKDPVEAKARFADALREIEAQWAKLDSGSQPLTHKQAVALAGEFYRDLVARHEDEPGSPESWQERIDSHRLALTRQQPPGGNYARFARPLREWLEARGIQIEHEELLKLLHQTIPAKLQADEHLLRLAQGDYRPDPEAARFPAYEPATQAPAVPTVPFAPLFEAYVAARRLAPRTVKKFRPILEAMVAHVGTDDMAAVTEAHLLAWRDALVAGGNLDPVSIKDGYIAAAKAFFGWARYEKKLPSNPAAEVRVSTPGKKEQLHGKEFTTEEWTLILKATAGPFSELISPEHAAARRWVPWLCACTGARVGEMTQLRASDVAKVDGLWTIRITPETGTVKTRVARTVPLYPHLEEQGFLAFAKSRSGPLFYAPSRQRGGKGGTTTSERMGQKLAE